MKYKILISLVLTTFYYFNNAHAFVTVGDGSDANCDYSNLQSAIDSQEIEIRTTNQAPFNGSYSVINQNINLIGGFDNCHDASENKQISGNKSIIQGIANGHLLVIDGGGVANNISLFGFDIKNSMQGSGLYLNDINGSVKIENSILQNNNANEGGGLYVKGADTNLAIINSTITNNQALSKGGGVYCEAASIKINSNSLVSNNQVLETHNTGDGGGLYAYLCHVEIYAGHSDGFSAGFIGNQSTRDGAGIYASSSDVLINGQQESIDNPVLGDNTQPALFKDNLSDSNDDGTGYGAALHFRNSTATIQAAWFDGNKGSSNGEGSYNSGSVFHAKLRSSVEMISDNTQPCWREGLCNLVTNNQHIAMVLTRSYSMTIKNTEFSNNTVNTTALILIDSFRSVDTETESILIFEGNLVHDNVSDNVGLLKSNSRTSDENCCSMAVNVFNNTITQNQFTGEIFNINDDTIFNMHGNIVYEEVVQNPVVDIFNSAFTDANISCLMAHEVSSLPNITLNTVVDNPLFVDATNGDFHLSESSPAIDFCDNSQYTPSTIDIDLQFRDYDNLDSDDFEGWIDLGVDEYYPPDIIFRSNFEISAKNISNRVTK